MLAFCFWVRGKSLSMTVEMVSLSRNGSLLS